jgi:hypothetical protein
MFEVGASMTAILSRLAAKSDDRDKAMISMLIKEWDIATGLTQSITIEEAIAAERELCAKTVEWEFEHGTNGIGLAAAIRAGHRRTE